MSWSQGGGCGTGRAGAGGAGDPGVPCQGGAPSWPSMTTEPGSATPPGLLFTTQEQEEEGCWPWVNLFPYHAGKCPWKCPRTAKEGRPECAGREQLLGIQMTARECWFCFVLSQPWLCSAWARQHSNPAAHGALHMEILWKSQGET